MKSVVVTVAMAAAAATATAICGYYVGQVREWLVSGAACQNKLDSIRDGWAKANDEFSPIGPSSHLGLL